MGKKGKRVEIYSFPNETYTRLKEEAQRRKRSVSNMIVVLVGEALNQRDRRRNKE